MRKKVVVLVDGENISAKNADTIIAKCDRLGNVMERKVYHRQKDPITREWSEKSRSGAYKDICLCGSPAKNKVNQKIQKDARKYLKSSDVDLVCIVTSDGGYRRLSDDNPDEREKLCYVGGRNPSRKLRNSGARFIKLP